MSGDFEVEAGDVMPGEAVLNEAEPNEAEPNEAEPAGVRPLSVRQERAITALLSAPSQEVAAEVAGISSITLWRYLKQPAFRDAYRDAKRESMGVAVALLQRKSIDAVRTLESVANNEDASASARVSAAKVILDLGLRAVEMDDLSSRVEAMEETVRSLKNEK